MDKRLGLAIWSSVSCIVSELSKTGLVDVADIVESMQQTSAATRAAGDPEGTADLIHFLSEHLLKTVPGGAIAPPDR